MTLAAFEKKWLGGRTDYDKVYAYQCVDLILQYIAEHDGIKTGVWGNAIDYWRYPSPALLKKYKKISSKTPQRGDIVIFNGNVGNPYGHIAIAVSPTKMLEQNGATGDGDGKGGDEIRYRTIPQSRIAGILRPISSKPTYPRKVRVIKVWGAAVRSQPRRSASLAGSRYLPYLSTFTAVKRVKGESVNGNPYWYQSSLGNYVWAGNCK